MKDKIWNLQTIKLALERFKQEHNRLPTAREMDTTSYLPTSRTIQRRFGGLEHLRAELGFKTTNFGKGESRSTLATNIQKRSMDSEQALQAILIQTFGEMFVHIEKPFGMSSKQRLDFYIYSPNGNFGVDIFAPKDLFSMVGSLNKKQITYESFKQVIYLVVDNDEISQIQVDRLVNNKSNQLSKNFITLTKENFLQLIKKLPKFIATHRQGIE